MRRFLGLLAAVLVTASAVAVGATDAPAADGPTATAAAKRAKPVKLARNAQRVNGIRASKTPRAGRLLPLGKDGRFPASVLPLVAPSASLPTISPCGPGTAIASVAASGATTCEPTTMDAGPGLTREGRTLRADTTVLQQRLGAPCAAGSALAAVAQDGTTTCVPAVPGVTADATLRRTASGAGVDLGVAVPLTLTAAATDPVLQLSAAGTGRALSATSSSSIQAASFVNTGSGGGIRADTGPTSTGSAITAYNAGTDRYAGEFELTNAANSRAAIYARTAGNGQAIDAEVNSNTNGDALFARTTSSSASSYAGVFSGNVQISGTLSKSSGTFEIDHPLDPANRVLRHSFVESPDMKNLYDGVVTTGDDGRATVTMPEWFEALNRDFRYQLTPIGSFSRVMVASEMDGNQFTIRSEEPRVRVSWQVTGTRHDAWANAHRVVVDEAKAPDDRGRYLTPREFGKPLSRSLLRRGE